MDETVERFKKRSYIYTIRVNVLLFVVTIISVLLAGLLVSFAHAYPALTADQASRLTISNFLEWIVIKDAILFTLALLTFLTAHEMGHYISCRRYGVIATLPYYIPFPTIFGTMGAFIKIKSPIPSRKALFDIGVAGPLAGFVFVVPWMYFGLKWSSVVPISSDVSKYYLQDPLLTQFLINLMQIKIPAGYEISAHPVFLAAWFGAIATAINLIPVGQLDGGHIVFSIFRKRSKFIYYIAFGLTCVLGVAAMVYEEYPGWAIWILIVFFLMRKGHPPTLDDNIRLGGQRYVFALVAMIVFIITFMPVPIRIG